MDVLAKVMREDGGVSIVVFAPAHVREQTVRYLISAKGMNPARFIGMSDAELYTLAKHDMDAVLAGVLEREKNKNGFPNITRIDRADTPQDRYFRNAWGHDLKVDMDKAREIQMEHIRRARDKALKALDVETMKGRDVQAEKQVLRDLPETFDLTAAQTPEELKALWPRELDDQATP